MKKANKTKRPFPVSANKEHFTKQMNCQLLIGVDGKQIDSLNGTTLQ